MVPFGEICSLAGGGPTLGMGLESSWPLLAVLSPAPALCLLLDARPPLDVMDSPFRTISPSNLIFLYVSSGHDVLS